LKADGSSIKAIPEWIVECHNERGTEIMSRFEELGFKVKIYLSVAKGIYLFKAVRMNDK
jgi:hypothetical protein